MQSLQISTFEPPTFEREGEYATPPFKCTQFECLTRQFSPQLKLIPKRKIIPGLTRTPVSSVKRKKHSGQVERYACNIALKPNFYFFKKTNNFSVEGICRLNKTCIDGVKMNNDGIV